MGRTKFNVSNSREVRPWRWIGFLLAWTAVVWLHGAGYFTGTAPATLPTPVCTTTTTTPTSATR